jgi:hypothetical protein
VSALPLPGEAQTPDPLPPPSFGAGDRLQGRDIPRPYMITSAPRPQAATALTVVRDGAGLPPWGDARVHVEALPVQEDTTRPLPVSYAQRFAAA